MMIISTYGSVKFVSDFFILLKESKWKVKSGMHVTTVFSKNLETM
uniref:Uncharacterized protein n=1 Tax=Heterorhabditis bacteriophora TaxID=37862 RepID=A0A1I7WW76_HETBA